jgi:hypothetical protein
VRAFKTDLRREEVLRETQTDGAGRYEMTYTAERFRRDAGRAVPCGSLQDDTRELHAPHRLGTRMLRMRAMTSEESDTITRLPQLPAPSVKGAPIVWSTWRRTNNGGTAFSRSGMTDRRMNHATPRSRS